MIVAYNGANFNASSAVGHSNAFVVTTTANTALQATQTGAPNASGFSVFTVPEPSVLALSSIGAAALMLFRKKK